MAEITNPYRPGEPVADPAMLFGRQDAADWIERQVNSNSQALVLSASPLIGKTSFVNQVGVLQSMNAVNIVMDYGLIFGLGLDVNGGNTRFVFDYRFSLGLVDLTLPTGPGLPEVALR